METLNKIVNRGGNVNFTTTITAEEANNTISLFAQLVNLSKFALASQPERYDAIQKIKYHLEKYEASDSQRLVFEKVMEILSIE